MHHGSTGRTRQRGRTHTSGVRAVYLTYYPDLAVPGAVEATRSFAELAIQRGVPRLVLLSGRGEPEAERAEQAVRDTGADLTILRSTWFMQNFSEDYMLDHVLSGEVRLPAGDVPTPFLDADDIADVAVAALTDSRHVGKLYELTGLGHSPSPRSPRRSLRRLAATSGTCRSRSKSTPRKPQRTVYRPRSSSC